MRKRESERERKKEKKKEKKKKKKRKRERERTWFAWRESSSEISSTVLCCKPTATKIAAWTCDKLVTPNRFWKYNLERVGMMSMTTW